ncbi:MAG: cobalamin-dependent protein [Thermodesulfobacteriota bacterium]
MKIFLIFSRKLAKESYVPPIGIMSLAAVLRQKGYTDIKLFDLAFHSRDLIVRECMNSEPDVIGLSTDSISFENGSKLLGEIKEQCKNGTYIIGGVHPTITPEQALLKQGLMRRLLERERSQLLM